MIYTKKTNLKKMDPEKFCNLEHVNKDMEQLDKIVLHTYDEQNNTEAQIADLLSKKIIYNDISTDKKTIAAKSYDTVEIASGYISKSGYKLICATVIEVYGNYCTYAIISPKIYNGRLSVSIYNPLDGLLSIGMTVRFVYLKEMRV